MDKTIDYTSWTAEEIQNQVQILSATSDLTYRRSNYLVELGDGIIRFARLHKDKSWSDWTTIETPNLHVTEGKIVADGNASLIIRVSLREAYEICSVNDCSWSDDKLRNVFNQSRAPYIIGEILTGKSDEADLLTTRTTPPGIPFQTRLMCSILFSSTHKYYSDKAEKLEAADQEYEMDGWIKYFPFEKAVKVWTPGQEVAYLKTLLKSKKRAERKRSIADATPKTKNNDKKSPVATSENNSPTKNYMVAAILAIVLGGIGAHKFYMGKFKMGILYLIFCWTYIPSVVGVLEGLIYLNEGQDKFNERFNS